MTLLTKGFLTRAFVGFSISNFPAWNSSAFTRDSVISFGSAFAMQDVLVVSANGTFDIFHAAVADIDGVTIKIL